MSAVQTFWYPPVITCPIALATRLTFGKQQVFSLTTAGVGVPLTCSGKPKPHSLLPQPIHSYTPALWELPEGFTWGQEVLTEPLHVLHLLAGKHGKGDSTVVDTHPPLQLRNVCHKSSQQWGRHEGPEESGKTL
ncbi:hypothetical protein Bbelb_337510 [Branchiostoma belcheri]|nr:hypothetical protein Bbelb_337510 [Branchiostoma belcheri]